MKKVISAGIIIFRRTKEGIKFLILYHGGDYWYFPKGKIEAEERSWETALREVEEETGIKPRELKLLRNFKTKEQFTYSRGREKISKIVILFLAETRQPNVRVFHGRHSGYGWFTFKEAKSIMSKFKDSVTILERANAFLQRKRIPSRGVNTTRTNSHVQTGRGASGQSSSGARRRQHSEQKPAPQKQSSLPSRDPV
ncbi:MAG: hypothetical protein COU08_02295 [Candidatus Harrisonbacteria bacterium CG10_big_fil_rev_8_21_14_0_10_42_17]|uniref:Bis(5'-nucleosyl)-tetraphosphatase [asymmetrical] n=1 Tax=Candidatus Harrisonbacteria bacterium CG10_big_fil_rev_8_21_14_0_10_42_17 TaxID=1974584 RepID=A0A2M6WI74_9BACT|nr:MAG: hypothetical protein COU08_02295 [Candidatus Harrisonbacteria bacterium CG10_big_fil_rev_8_21_14_0_10_42_17]